MLAYYFDEQVPSAITRGLRARGVDVLRVQDAGQANTDDGLILDRAAQLGRVVFTRDADFLREAHRRQAAGEPFAGVVYAQQAIVSIGQCIRDLERLAGLYELLDMADRVVFLPLRG